MKGGVYDVAFRNIKIVKSWSQKVKSQVQSVKLALIELTCQQNCLTCLDAMILTFLKRWEQRFPFKTTMKKRKRRFLGPFHHKIYCLNKSWQSKVVQIQAWTHKFCPGFNNFITKATQGQQNERRVFDVAFRKIKIVKSWSQKVKSQDQSVKLALIELTC